MIDDKIQFELTFKTSRSGGAGGQHVNKTETRVELFFNVRYSAALSMQQKIILQKKLRSKLTEDGELRIVVSDTRSQIRNKDEMIQEILKNNNFNKAFFVGDTVNDGLSANLNQLPFVLASYGYGRDQDWSKVNVKHTIYKLSEIL